MWLAKTKVTTSYLYLAKKLGAEVDQFHEVSDLVPLDRGGFEVHSRESCFRVARGIRPCSARNLVCAEAFDASEPSGAELGAPGASQESRRCKHKSRSDPAVGCTAGIGTLDSHAAGGGDTRASVNAGVCVASASDVLVANPATVELAGRSDFGAVSSLPCLAGEQGRCAASLVSADSRADTPLPSFARI